MNLLNNLRHLNARELAGKPKSFGLVQPKSVIFIQGDNKAPIFPMLSLAIPTPPEIQLTQTNETRRMPWRNHSLLKKRLLVG
ncbi:hypothetical protein FLR06_13605 [Listeria monocytogenes]|nr:hypothetical protein [Listeria monocytogenes]ECB9517237.1 hypothetical protein [Listeria monocytogenes]ECB9523584.1 hypothetical protein [Listeria monocytogenes]ECB9528722.1 hypothetical protein [Listeria monocytogenes]TYU99613.1 hypothetical protein FZW97_08445 [Listeria monocytogenes]